MWFLSARHRTGQGVVAKVQGEKLEVLPKLTQSQDTTGQATYPDKIWLDLLRPNPIEIECVSFPPIHEK